MISSQNIINESKEKEENISKNKKELHIEDKEIQYSFNCERIDLDFPENYSFKSDKQQCYPESYYTLSKKERVILLFVEAFRLKFHTKYPYRRPLVLAIKNECNVQKFVCTTIRPTALKFPKLIRSFEECCSFVADFIVYEPLENLNALPPRLISPDTLLNRRQGNSFEIATLLCSFLIGEGFPAMIVSGIAKSEVIMNDQHNEECPYLSDIMKSLNYENNSTIDNTNDSINYVQTNKYDEEFFDPRKLVLEEMPSDIISDQKYVLKDNPESIKYHLKPKEMQFIKKDKNDESTETLPEEIPQENGGIHAWIVIIEKNRNAENENCLNVYFVEPSTGLRHEITSSNYIHVDSIWNHENYYVNIQDKQISDMSWELDKTHNWERFLPGQLDNEIKELDTQNIPERTKILLLQSNFDLTPSWVQKLQISLEEYQKRYQNSEKIVHYKRVIYERFSPYFQKNGLITRSTIYDDDYYENASLRLEWYENRIDNLCMIKTDLKTNQIEEYFSKGRPDKLKAYKYNKSQNTNKEFEFFYQKRADSLKECYLSEEKLKLCFGKRNDLCFYQEFCKDSSTGELKEITDMYHRNENIPSENDVAIRNFYLTKNKIIVKYHYSIGANIAIIKEFTKPLERRYSKEIIFDTNLVKSYNTNEYQNLSTPYDNYMFLLQLLKDEKNLKKEFHKRMNEMIYILENRQQETENPYLKFDIFDPLRNQDARNLHIQKLEEEVEQKLETLSGPPDYLAPYLIHYQNLNLNYEQSLEIYSSCLKDIKSRYTRLLNELQRKYDELIKEDDCLEKFLSKYHDQSDISSLNIDDLKEKRKNIQIQKRIIKNRLLQTHEQAQNKYEQLEKSLLTDSRLKLT